jgi:hypothetical protein
MNEEIGRLKEKVTLLSETIYKEKLDKVKQKLESFSRKPIDKKMVEDIFYIQDLVAEISKNES